MARIALFIGDSTGVKILRNYIFRKILITYVVSTDNKYDKIIKKICNENKTKFFLKEEINNKFHNTLNKNTDVILSIFSRYIFSKNFIKNFKGVIYNMHPGLLPYYPGTNSISGTLYNCEKFTGVSIHAVTNKIDQGDIVLSKKFRIKQKDLAITVWQNIQKISLILAKKFYEKFSKDELLIKKNNIKKRKKFPKFIPNNGVIKPNLDDLKKILTTYRASYYFPFRSPWGSLKILYKKKLLYINNIKIVYGKNYVFKDIKKITNKIYLVKLFGDKTIKVKVI